MNHAVSLSELPLARFGFLEGRECPWISVPFRFASRSPCLPLREGRTWTRGKCHHFNWWIVLCSERSEEMVEVCVFVATVLCGDDRLPTR